MRRHTRSICAVLVVVVLGLALAAPAAAQEQPKMGGVLKIATIGAPLALRLRVTDQFVQDRAAQGVRILGHAAVARRQLYLENFNAGAGAFKNGELVDGGADGTKAYAFTNKAGAIVEGPFKSPVTAETTVRVKLKPLFDAKHLHAMLWSNVHKKNAWYHLPKLPKDEWTVVEFQVASARVGYKMDGPGLEGDVPARLTIYQDDPAVADAALICINPDPVDGREEILLSTGGHETGHGLFEAPKWVLARQRASMPSMF